MLQVAAEREGRAGLAGTRYLTPDERRVRGKALRQRVPRQDHGAWEPPEGRRDPIDLLSEANEGRLPNSFRSALDGCRNHPLPSIAARRR
jgi:hypothetical protein